MPLREQIRITEPGGARRTSPVLTIMVERGGSVKVRV